MNWKSNAHIEMEMRIQSSLPGSRSYFLPQVTSEPVEALTKGRAEALDPYGLVFTLQMYWDGSNWCGRKDVG